MPEKLMTLKELSEHLKVSEDRLAKLVEERVIPAYKIGGELLRFRREQIDAMIHEIDRHLSGRPDREARSVKSPSETLVTRASRTERNTFIDIVKDFFYFNDFYILSAAIAGVLLAVIFRK